MLTLVKTGFCRAGGVVEAYTLVLKRKKIILVFIIRAEELFVRGPREIGDVREVDVQRILVLVRLRCTEAGGVLDIV
jgi:hypothetical protein